ncbi:unnamed protein product [Arctogadus glacialis]
MEVHGTTRYRRWYERLRKERGPLCKSTSGGAPLCVDCALNLAACSTLHSGRNGKMRVLSFKAGLVSLCKADVKEKYKLEVIC